MEVLLSEFYFIGIWLLNYDSVSYTPYALISGIVKQSLANGHLVGKSICEWHSQGTE